MDDAITEPTGGDGGERERVLALHSLELMGTPPEERFDRITRLARDFFDVPVAAVNLLDERELFIKSPNVPGSRTRDRSETFCDVTSSRPGLLVVEDAAADPRFASKPDVAGGRGVRFYAGRPLTPHLPAATDQNGCSSSRWTGAIVPAIPRERLSRALTPDRGHGVSSVMPLLQA